MIPYSTILIRTVASTIATYSLSAAIAQGATIRQDFVLSSSTTVIGPTGSSVVIDPYDFFRLEINQFDPGLGTLDQIDFIYDLSFTASGTTGDSGGTLALEYSGVFYADGNSFFGSGAGNETGDGPNQPLTLTVGMSQNLINNIDVQLTHDEATGLATFELLFQGDLDFSADSLGSNDATLDFEGGSVSWIYQYTPVPEPAFPSMMSISGALFLFWRRRNTSFHCRR